MLGLNLAMSEKTLAIDNTEGQKLIDEIYNYK